MEFVYKLADFFGMERVHQSNIGILKKKKKFTAATCINTFPVLCYTNDRGWRSHTKQGNESSFPAAVPPVAISKLSSWAKTLLRKKNICWLWHRHVSVALGITCPWLSGTEDLHSIFMNPHKAIVLQFLIDCLYVMRTTNIDMSEWLRKVSCDCFSLTQAAKVAGWVMFCCMQRKAHYLNEVFLTDAWCPSNVLSPSKSYSIVQ